VLHIVAQGKQRRLPFEEIVDTPGSFSGRLAFALKVINMSPAALGAAVSVDKSVVSRWLSGKVTPSGHNLARISAEIARRRPDFSTLSFEASASGFLAALEIEAPGDTLKAVAQPDGIILPHDAIEDSRNETARRGMEYYGHYAMYYWSFSRPGRIARMALMLRPSNGLIEARYGADGFEFGGWALLLLNRLYIQFSEKRFQAMVFMVTNPGQQPRAQQLTGLLMGPSDRLMVPTVSPMVLVRVAEVDGDPEQDEADFQKAQAFDPFAEGQDAPPEIRKALIDMVRVTQIEGAGVGLLQADAIDPKF
jgi:transcriptional regulator with XRE-family HTH domain